MRSREVHLLRICLFFPRWGGFTDLKISNADQITFTITISIQNSKLVMKYTLSNWLIQIPAIEQAFWIFEKLTKSGNSGLGKNTRITSPSLAKSARIFSTAVIREENKRVRVGIDGWRLGDGSWGLGVGVWGQYKAAAYYPARWNFIVWRGIDLSTR